MSLVLKINGVDVPAEAVKMIGRNDTIPGGVQGLPSSAYYGETSTATILVDDPQGQYDFRAWQVLTADETAATGKPRIFTGWVWRARINRSGYLNGASRVWELDIIDQNACLGFEVFRASSAKRPAETDLVRVDFILESAPMGGTPVAEGPLTNLTDNPRDMQEANYVGQFPIEALTSIAQSIGKQFHVFWNHDDEELQLFYDFLEEYPATTVAVSNVRADVDNSTVFYPFRDGEEERAGDEIITGELLMWRGGAAYARSDDTIDRLSPTPLSPVEFRRDFVRNTDRVGKASTAQQVILDDLAAHAEEADTVTVTVRLPAAQVNDIEAGQRLSARFQHLPGFEAGASVNVIRRNVVPTTGRRDMYDVHLELSDKGTFRNLDGIDPGVFPKQPCIPLLVQHAEGSGDPDDPDTYPVLASPPVEGNLQVAWIAARADPTTEDITPDGFTGLGTDFLDDPSATKEIMCRLFYRWTEAGDPQTITLTTTGSIAQAFVSVAEFIGVNTLNDYDELLDATSQGGDPIIVGAGPVSVDPIAGRPALSIGAVMPSLNPNDAWFPHDSVGNTEIAASGVGGIFSGGDDAKSWFGYRAGPAAVPGGSTFYTVVDSPASGISRGHVGLVALFSGDPCDDDCPATGQEVLDEFVASGDGTTVLFNTRCPYADTTLKVRVDGVRIITGLTETNPATGEFSLDFAPLGAEGDAPAEQVFATYQGR